MKNALQVLAARFFVKVAFLLCKYLQGVYSSRLGYFCQIAFCRGMPRACPRERAFASMPRYLLRGSKCTE